MNNPGASSMPPTFVHARDYLESAVAILQATDSRTRQLRHIIERTIGLIDEFDSHVPSDSDNVYDLDAFRRARQG
jgi:septation ring formation regulator EzrA